MLRRLSARPASRVVAVGLLLTLGLHSAQAAGMAYTDAGGTNIFSTAISPTITAATSYANGDPLTFRSAAATPTNDISYGLNFNALTFSNTGAVTLNRGAGALIMLGATTGGTLPTVTMSNSGLVTDNLDLALASNTTFSGTGTGGLTISASSQAQAV